MSKQSGGNRKTRAQSSLATIPLSAIREPLAFERQLHAASRRPASAPRASWLEALCARLVQALQRLRKRLLKRHGRQRKLDLLEIQQLGEKRFVALVGVGKQKFLIAGAAGSVTLLAEFTPQRAAAARAPRQEGT